MSEKTNGYASKLDSIPTEYKAEVTISKPDVKEKNKKFTVYKVFVNYGSETWFVLRRYNEFSKLNDSIKKLYPNCNLKFPGKKLFGNNFDSNFLKSRKDGLNEFINKVTENNKFMQMPEVHEFLQIDRNKSCSSEGSNDISEDSNNGSETPPVLHSNGSDGKVIESVNIGTVERKHTKPTDFDFLKVIGKGSFGKVFLAKHKSENKLYAVKVLQKKMIIRRNETKHIMSERNVLLKNLKHPFLVGLNFGFQTRDKLYFVLDYVNGGELFFHLQRERSFPESRARYYAAEISSALGYLHSEGIVYRDLKPENILLDSTGHTVLTDFGLCKEGLLNEETTTTFCGTPEYLAPEVIRKEPYDKSVDWWCFGAVMYEMMYGLPPFYNRDTSEMYNNILNKPPKLRAIISAAARDLLSKLLHKDRTQRLGSSADDFLDIKKHEFFQNVNWDDVLAKKITPPYNPNLNGALDLKHIDPEFTKEPIPASVGQQALSVSASVKEADDVFQGFSYAPPLDYE